VCLCVCVCVWQRVLVSENVCVLKCVRLCHRKLVRRSNDDNQPFSHQLYCLSTQLPQEI